MENMHVIGATELVKIYVLNARNHFQAECDFQDILLFREFLNENLINNEIPVRCAELTKKEIFDFVLPGFDFEKQNIRLEGVVRSNKCRDAIGYMVSLNITSLCRESYEESI